MTASVYVAGRGDYWHTRPDCPGIRAGQVAADRNSGEVQDVRAVYRGEARRLPGVKGPCPRCLAITEFVRCRLDDEAELAQAASPGPWHANAESDEVLAADGITVADGFALSGRQLRATTDHIARHDPPRVLADIDAKRAVVAAYEEALAAFNENGPAHVSYDRLTGSVSSLRHAVVLLAAVYDDHPDYKEMWA